MEPVRAGEIHPLQNPSILKIIFANKKLTLKDLKSCRQVCREWCSVSGSAMRKVMLPVWIRGYGTFISDFLEMVRVKGSAEIDYSVPPFMTKFKVHPLKIDYRTFWEFCGSSIKSLELYDVLFVSRNAFRHAIFQSCPNLEALSLSGITVGGEWVEEPTELVPPVFPPNHNLKSLYVYRRVGDLSWMEILSQFPRLEKFEQPEGSARGFLRSLALARNHDPQCWQMKHLRFCIDWFDDASALLAVLEDRTLPLETLQVPFIEPYIVPALGRIICNHAAMLKDLFPQGLRTPMNLREAGIVPLPNNQVFEKLETLHLHEATLEWPSFLRSFPNLKKLELSAINPVRSTLPAWCFGNWTSSCTQLELVLYRLETGDLRQLFVRLPKLERLELKPCNNDHFAVICELLPNLQHFILIDCKVDDVGFSGLDAEDVARINKAGDEGMWPLREARPNLSRLQNLKSFRNRDLWRRTIPGYTTAICFQKLPQLQHLHIPETSAHPIWNHLREQFPWRE